MTPLIGGPQLLRVHTAVYMDSGAGALVGWDFVPEAATSPSTVKRLLALRSAPGDRRQLAAIDGRDMFVLGPAVGRLEDVDSVALGSSGDLHLLTNNCWGHSLAVAAEALGTDRSTAALRAVTAIATRRVCEPPPPIVRPPAEVDPTAIALKEEKMRRYGQDLASFLSDEERLQAARAATTFEDALREAEAAARPKET